MKELLLKRKSRFVLYIFACFIPVFDKLLMDLSLSLLIGSVQVGRMEYFIRVSTISVGIVALGSILYIISRFLRISYMRDTLLDIRLLAFERILNLDYKEFNNKSKDSYISNLINDINIFENNFFLQLINLIFRGGVYLVSLTIIAFLDIRFAIISLLVSILLFYISRIFEEKTVRLQEEVSDKNEAFAVDMSNTFNGLEILKLNNVENRFLRKALGSITGLERRKLSYNIYSDTQRRIMEFLGFGFLTGSLVYVAVLMSGDVSLTRATLIVQLSNGCIWNITSILPLYNQLKSSVNIFNKITKGLEDNKSISKGDKEFSFEREIEVENLSFAYGDKEILKDVSFKIEKGKKYLIKGASGAGKTTLIKLLSMTYDDYKGRILVDDVDYKEIDDEKVLGAALKAGLDSLLEKKENGINEMLLENGKNLSGGERQRISIARAIVKDSEILFVDEGTSSLDEELGRLVEDTILSLDTTVIAISHRYYRGISERYDYVLEIKDKRIDVYEADKYFMEVAI